MYTSYSGTTFNGWKDGKSGGYIPANAPYYNNGSYTQYTTTGNTLEVADDAARQILKGDWQLPTKEIWVALYDANQGEVYWGPNNGDKTLETISEIKGMKISKKDDSNTYIFLPAAGYVNGLSFTQVGSYGRYWSGTASISDSTSKPYILRITSGSVMAQAYYSRYFGLPVRPVRLVEVSQSQQ